MAAEKNETRLLIHREDRYVQVEFLDRNILDESVIQHIGDEITQLIEESPTPRILLNFQKVEHLSSAALGTLITLNNRVKKKGGQLRLSNIDAQIYEVFVITKLNKLFQIFDDVEAAVQSFK